ncbi:hypothetical protein, partial [Frigoriflavimonas asaccharolytica]
GPSLNASVGIGAGPAAAAGVTYSAKDPSRPFNNAIISTYISGGIGVRAGASAASLQVGVNYTPASGVHQIIRFK